MGVRVRLHKGSWYVFINPLKCRKAKKIGPGEAGKRLAMRVAGKIRTRLAHGEDIDGPRDIPTLGRPATSAAHPKKRSTSSPNWNREPFYGWPASTPSPVT